LVGPPKKRLLKILKNWDTWTTIINSYWVIESPNLWIKKGLCLVDTIQKIKNIRSRIRRIERKHPTFDFSNLKLCRDIIKYLELKEELSILGKDTLSCKSDDPLDMCSHCNCWKHTRAMCS
jgi:hypothetical protein